MKNLYFDTYNNSPEQTLYEDLIVESLSIYGLDIWYIPRNVDVTKEHFDDMMNDVQGATFSESYLTTMYVKNVDSFGGDGTFMSKFGLQIRDQITFTSAMKTFDLDVSQQSAHNHNYDDHVDEIFSHTIANPREGDLIYFPLNKKVFEINFVEQEAVFYQLGALQTYDIVCELFEFSGEIFNTGIPDIDGYYEDLNKTFKSTTQSEIEEFDPFADNFTIEKTADKIIDFDESHSENPYGW